MQVQTVLDQVPVWRLQKLRCLRYIRYEHLRFFHCSFSDCVRGYISRNVSGAAFFLCNTLRSTFTKDNLHSRKRPSEQNYFLSDMHNHVYGKQNNKLFEAIKAEQPDLILIGGDMLVAKNDVRYQEALDLSVVCRSSARFIMPVEIMNRESKRIRKTILCVMKSIVKSYRQKGFVFWKMKVAIFCWEINRFISADWNSH